MNDAARLANGGPDAGDPAQPDTLAGRLAARAARSPDRFALADGERSLTYARLAADSAAVAARLTDLGLRPGDRVAVVARNAIAGAQLLYAASWAGLVLVNVNWRLTPAEVGAVLDDAVPALVLCDEASAHLVAGREALPLERLADWTAAPPHPASVAPRADPGQVVLMLYTTGTTGLAKGVQHTEAGVAEMSRQARSGWRMHEAMRFLCALPFFHVGGLTCLITALDAGGAAIFPGGTDSDLLVTTIERFSVTHANFVPTVLSGILATRAPEHHDLSSLEVVIYGAAPAGEALLEGVKAMLPGAGFSQGYGLTETMAGVAIAPILRHGDADPAPGSVGRVVPSAEVRIVDPDDGADTAPGADGEIWLRTPQLMAGYWRRPADSAAAVDADGWFRTGDIGCLDEAGNLYLRDRLKDMIISGGENIYSVEVENAVATHPSVLECAVVGVADPRWGETVKAVVVLRPGRRLDLEELRRHLGERLARYKQPRILEVVRELPRAGSGKVLKRELRGERQDDASAASR